MRVKDKKEAILKSVLKLVNREGFYHLNMKKVAAEAGIAAGTIYLYFKGKEAIINDLYLLIIQSFNQEVLRGAIRERSLKENFYDMVNRALTFYLADTDKFSFVEQYTYSPFLFKESQDANFLLFRPIFNMIREGKKQKRIKPLPDAFLLSLVHGPLNMALKLHLAHKIDLTKKGVKEKLYNAVWESIVVDGKV